MTRLESLLDSAVIETRRLGWSWDRFWNEHGPAVCERAAIEAHSRGWSWDRFWNEYGPAVCLVVNPNDFERFLRLVGPLNALVVAGDTDGMEPAGDDEPWLRDEQTQVVAPLSDTATEA